MEQGMLSGQHAVLQNNTSEFYATDEFYTLTVVILGTNLHLHLKRTFCLKTRLLVFL